MKKILPLFIISALLVLAGCSSQIIDDSKINIKLQEEANTGSVTLEFSESARTILSYGHSDINTRTLSNVTATFTDESTKKQVEATKKSNENTWTLLQGIYTLEVTAKCNDIKLKGSVTGVKVTSASSSVTVVLYPVYEGEGNFEIKAVFLNDWNNNVNQLFNNKEEPQIGSVKTVTGSEALFMACITSFDGEYYDLQSTATFTAADDGYYKLTDLSFASEENIPAGFYKIYVNLFDEQKIPVLDDLIEFIPGYSNQEITLIEPKVEEINEEISDKQTYYTLFNGTGSYNLRQSLEDTGYNFSGFKNFCYDRATGDFYGIEDSQISKIPYGNTDPVRFNFSTMSAPVLDMCFFDKNIFVIYSSGALCNVSVEGEYSGSTVLKPVDIIYTNLRISISDFKGYGNYDELQLNEMSIIPTCIETDGSNIFMGLKVNVSDDLYYCVSEFFVSQTDSGYELYSNSTNIVAYTKNDNGEILKYIADKATPTEYSNNFRISDIMPINGDLYVLVNDFNEKAASVGGIVLIDSENRCFVYNWYDSSEPERDPAKHLYGPTKFIAQAPSTLIFADEGATSSGENINYIRQIDISKVGDGSDIPYYTVKPDYDFVVSVKTVDGEISYTWLIGSLIDDKITVSGDNVTIQ